MVSIPVPFVGALLLIMLAITNHERLRETPTGTLFGWVIWLYAISLVLIGFRWELGLVALFPLAAVAAVTGVVLLYLAFVSLGRSGPVLSVGRDWVHFIPVGLIPLCALIAPSLGEFVLMFSKIAYAALLLKLAKAAPDSLQLVRLSSNFLRFRFL